MAEKRAHPSDARRSHASATPPENALEQEAFQKALTEGSRDAVFLLDESGRILKASRSAEVLYGTSPQELVGLEFQELQVDGAVLPFEEWTAGEADRWAVSAPARHRREDGSVFTAELTFRTVPVNGRRFFAATVADVTRRVEAEGALHEADVRFYDLVDAAAATIFILQDGHFVEVNAAAEALTGYTREELLNIHFLQLVHPDFREMVGGRTQARVEGADPPSRYEFKILRKDGQSRWIDISVGRTTFRGRPALIDSVWDITERKRAAADLARQNRLYRTLSAVNQVLVRAEDEAAMLSETCRILTGTGGYRLACVRLRDEATGEFSPFCRAGEALDFCQGRCGKTAMCCSLSCREMRRGDVVLVQDTQADPLCAPWRELTRTHRLFSTAALPLYKRGRHVGIVQLYGGEGEVFGPDETALLRELAGDLEYALIALEDRRERESAEAALVESEKRYRQLFERNVAGGFRSTQNGRILECNPALARIFGAASPEEMKAHSAAEIYAAPEDRRTYLEELNANGQLNNLEWLGRKLDGTPVWVLENAALVDDPHFEEPVLEGTLVDITDLKEAERALRESEKRFRTLAETSAAGILVFQGDHFVYGNPAARSIGEIDEDDFGTMRFWDPAHPRFRETVRELGRACLQGEFAPRRFELQIVTKRGRSRWLDCTLARAEMAGRPAGVITAVDITERRRADRLQTALYVIAQAALVSTSLEDLLPEVHAAMRKLVPPGGYFLALSGGRGPGLEFAYFAGEDGSLTPPSTDGGPEAWVYGRGEPLLADRAKLDELAASGEIAHYPAGCTGWLGVPLRLRDGIIGVMGMVALDEDVRFEPHHREALELAASQIAMAVDRLNGEEALRESEYKFRMLAENSAAGILIYRGEHIVYGNPAAWAMTGYSREEFCRLRFWELVHPDHREMVKARGLARQRGETVPSRYEFKIVTKSGESRWVDFTAGMIPYEGRTASVGMAFDVTERKAAEDQLARFAHYDALTGLPNQVLLKERLGRHLEVCALENRRLTVIYLGLDRFKEINDTAGHEVGDELLREAGRRLVHAVGDSGEVSRMGSDEFVVVLAGAEDPSRVEACVQDVFEAFKRPLRVAGRDFHLGLSAGVSFFPDDARAPEDLLRCADIAMSGAKSVGGGSIEFFKEGMGVAVSERADLRQRLRDALLRGELEAYYQPIVASRDGRILSTEALVRWRQPDGSVMCPGQFIDVAEESELIITLDQFMLRTACAQRKAWNEAGLPKAQVSVNLSGRQFLRPGLSRMVEEVLRETRLPPEQLVLEITEATAMWDVESTTPLLRELGAAGIGIAIDDFGSGYSSLMYLKRLPVRFLKIPRVFIRDLPHSVNDVAIVKAVIDMAHGLHLSVTAEGVESAEQSKFLADAGCDALQGFHCGHPLPASCMEEILAGPPGSRPPGHPGGGEPS